jgi:hypothetical protein
MKAARQFALATFALLGLSMATARAGVFIGIGAPVPYYRHFYRPYYYGPRVVIGLPPVYVGPAPVYVQPAQVYVQPAHTVIQAPPVQYVPAPTQAPQVPPAPSATPSTSALPPAPIPVGGK